jgi:hypothetical protein
MAGGCDPRKHARITSNEFRDGARLPAPEILRHDVMRACICFFVALFLKKMSALRTDVTVYAEPLSGRIGPVNIGTLSQIYSGSVNTNFTTRYH